MKKKFLTVLLSSFFILNLLAQENALLWEISKEGFYTSYLYGTIHLSDKRVFQFCDVILPKLYQCDAYAGEIIIQPEDILKMLPFLFENDIEKQCKNAFSEKQYEKIEKVVVETLGEEMQIILPIMSPYVVSVLLSYPSAGTEIEKDSHFLDMYLQEQADSLEKKLISLESIESQFAYINNIEIEAQKKHLLKVITEKTLNADIEKLIQVYVDEDLKKMKKILLAHENEDPIINEEFMNERNLIHKNGMLKAMKEQSTFTAVGAAHLVGEKGIISLLKAEGFTLIPIFK